MATDITFEVSNQKLSREENAVIFQVRSGDGKQGQLHVSKGGIRWRAKNSKKARFLNWTQFNSLFVENVPQESD